MKFGPSSQRFKLGREKPGYVVHRLFSVARGFNFHQLTDCLDHLVPALLEIAQPFVPSIARHGCWCGCFLAGHIFLSLTGVYRFAVNATRYSIIFRLFETNP